MNLNRAEQRLMEIDRLIDKAIQGIKKMKSYVVVVRENEKLRSENILLRETIKDCHEIATSAIPSDEKAQQISSYLVRSLYLVDTKVNNNER